MIDKLAPMKSVRVKQDVPPWSLTPEVKKARCWRDRAHRKALKTNSSMAWAEFRHAQLRNKATSVMRHCKAEYISSLASDCQNNPRSFWKQVQHLSNHNKAPPKTTETFSANEFNQHFLAIAHKLQKIFLC